MSDSLEDALQRIESIRVETAPAGAVAFGIIEDVIGDPRARLGELMDSLWKSVASYADVETPAARTRASWGGDIATVVKLSASPEDLRSHRQTVVAVIAWRTNLFHIAIAATTVLRSLALATLTPTAIPSAFRAGWKLATELESVLGAKAQA